MITVLMPLADGHAIHPDVLAGIVMQSVESHLIPISRPELENKRVSEAVCRRLLTKYATHPYSVFLDSDVVFVTRNDIQDAITFMDEHQEVDIGAYNSKRLPPRGHVPIGCAIVRTDRILDYSWPVKHKCHCLTVGQVFNVRLIDNRKLSEVTRWRTQA